MCCTELTWYAHYLTSQVCVSAHADITLTHTHNVKDIHEPSLGVFVSVEVGHEWKDPILPQHPLPSTRITPFVPHFHMEVSISIEHLSGAEVTNINLRGWSAYNMKVCAELNLRLRYTNCSWIIHKIFIFFISHRYIIFVTCNDYQWKENMKQC